MATALTTNAFAVLGASPRADAVKLNTLKADALFDDLVDEEAIETAYRELSVERTRLRHELAWLSDIAPHRAFELVDNPPADLATLPPLTAANLAAAALETGGSHDDRRCALLDAHGRIDWSRVRADLDAARSIARFTPTTQGEWETGIIRLVGDHGAVLALAYARSGQIDRFVQDLGRQWPASGRRLLDATLESYRTHVGAKLGIEIAAIADQLEEDEHNQLKAKLGTYASITAPMRLHDGAKGLDEPYSKQLFDLVRERCLRWANDEQRSARALAVTHMLEDALTGLPAAVRLRDDLATLADNVEGDRLDAALRPLRATLDRVEGQLADTSRLLLTHGFVAKPDALGDLIRCYDTAMQTAGAATAATRMVRSLAVALSNADHPAAALILVNALIARSPAAEREALAADAALLATLTRKQRVVQLMTLGSLDEARAAANEMPLRDRDDDWQSLSSAIDVRLRQRRGKRWFWGIAAAAIALAVVVERPTDRQSTFVPLSEVTEINAGDAMERTADDPPAVSPVGGSTSLWGSCRPNRSPSARYLGRSSAIVGSKALGSTV